MHMLALCFDREFLMFSLFKITKSYQIVIDKGRAIMFPIVNISIMIFVLERKLHKGKSAFILISFNLLHGEIFQNFHNM